MRRILLSAAITLVLCPVAGAATSVPSLTELEQWFAAADEKAAAVPPEARKELAYARTLRVPREEAIRSMLFMIALRPQSPAPHMLIQAMQMQRDPEQRGASMMDDRVADRAAAESFLENLYRSRMSAGDDEAIHWREGLAEHLLTIGRWEDARAVQAAIPESSDDYARTRRAIIDALNGDVAGLAKIQEENCQYCAVVARSLAGRMTDSIGTARVPPLMQDLLAGHGWTLPVESELRNLKMQAVSAPQKALARLRAIRTSPDTPQWAREDATYFSANAAFNTDKKTALAMIDCWLAQRNVTYPPVTEETWQKLVMLPSPEGDAGSIAMSGDSCDQETGPKPYDPLSACTQKLLLFRVAAAALTGDIPRARQSIEWMAGLVEKNEIGLTDLYSMLVMYAMTVGEHDDADRVRRYTALLPIQAEDVGGIREAVRRSTGRVSAPWEPQESPALVACP